MLCVLKRGEKGKGQFIVGEERERNDERSAWWL